MMERTGSARRVVVVLTTVLALVAVACGGGGGDGEASDGTATAPTTTTTSAAGGEGGGGEGADGGGEGAAGGGETPDGGEQPATGQAAPAPGGGDPAPAPPPGGGGAPAGAEAAAAEPARPGTYTYDTDGYSEVEGFEQRQEAPDTTTLEVDPPDGDRQRSVRDMRDARGNGATTETILQYRPKGIFLEYLKLTSIYQGVPRSFEFRPATPPMVAATGAGPGAHQEFALDSTDGKIHAEVTIDILREEEVAVGGQPVRTFLVRTVTQFSGEAEGESRSNDNISPEHRIPVREDSTLDARVGLNQFHSEQTSTLRSLEPR